MIPQILLTNPTNASDLLNIGSPQYAMRYTNKLLPPALKQMKKFTHLRNKNTLNNLVQYSLHTGQDMNSALDNSIEANLAMELSGFKLKRKSIGIEYEEEYIKTGLRRLGIANSYSGEELLTIKKTTAIKNNKHNQIVKHIKVLNE